MPISPSSSPHPALPIAPPATVTDAPRRSAFAQVEPRNAPASAASTGPAGSISLFYELRLRCMQRGAPATIDRCLQITSQQPCATHRAVLLQRLTLALADDRRIDSPAGPVNLRADACDTYRLAVPSQPPSYAGYQTALIRLHEAVRACKVVMPGTYGFLQQSIACESALRTAVNADQVRRALSGWLNWQWAALAAYASDPNLRALVGDTPLRPTHLAYALDDESALCPDVRVALLTAPAPAAAAGDPAPGSTPQRDQ